MKTGFQPVFGVEAHLGNEKKIAQILLVSVDLQTDLPPHNYEVYQARGYKTFFILISAGHETYPAHEC